MVKGLDNIVRDIVREILILMMGDRRIKSSNRLVIGVPMVSDNAYRNSISQTFGSIEQKKSAVAVTFVREYEADNKSSLRVNQNPKIMLNAVDFYESFIGMPGIRIEVQSRVIELGNDLKPGSKGFSPVMDGNMGDGEVEPIE